MSRTIYSPRDVVKDGPFTAARHWHHVLKALIALAIYAIFRDGFGFAPWLAAFNASPFFMVVVTVKEWNRPSDPNEWTYSKTERLDDFLTDFSCTSPAILLALVVYSLWLYALVLSVIFFALYLVCRPHARP